MMQKLRKDLADNILDLFRVLDTGGGLHYFAIAIINGEWKSAEGSAFRQAPDNCGIRDVEIHIHEFDIGVFLTKDIENIIDGNTHRSHSSTTDSNLFIAVDDLLQLFLACDVFEVGLKHL